MARAFLDAWRRGDYAAMYARLAAQPRAEIASENFVQFYQAALAEATITRVNPTFVSLLTEANTATVEYQARFDTALFGTIQEDNALALVMEGDDWRVLWSSTNFLRALDSGNTLKLYPLISTRGNIYDRAGQPLAIGQPAVAINLWPAEMRRQQSEARVLAALERILNTSQFDLQRRYANANPEWKIRIARVSSEFAGSNADALSLPGIITEAEDARNYPQGATAAHLVGYVGPISAEELAQRYAQGYREADTLGHAGLEKAEEKYLAGTRGGRLSVISAQGEETNTIREIPARQSQSVCTTIDLDLQKFCETLLGDQRGSIGVIDVRNGNVLALASRPSFDANAFVDPLRSRDRQTILTSPQKLLLNRAAQGVYPHGSVQKIITLSAALERGGMTANTTFTCNGVWNGLGYPKTCWIWAYGKTHGVVNLQRALTVSCDIAFYQVGLRLNQIDQNLMPSFSYAFGLGAPTGSGIEESAGNVPDPNNQQPWIPTDPVDMAIGQDTFLVSPLQVLNWIAAIANGGILWRPRLVSKIQDIVNGTEQTPAIETRANLPVSAPSLSVIHTALKGVTTDKDGAASFVFEGLPIVCAGKTGTAQVPGTNKPHAWFAGYAPADDPQIACVAMIENGGEGSKVAAPLFRRVVEKYFGIQPVSTPKPRPAQTPTSALVPAE